MKNEIVKYRISLVILTTLLLWVIFSGVYMIHDFLHPYLIYIYLLLIVLWWNGNLLTKLGFRIIFTIQSLLISLTLFTKDFHISEHFKTWILRLSKSISYEVTLLLLTAFITLTLGLFFINPNYKLKIAFRVLSTTGKLSIIFIWLCILALIIEQAYFRTRSNISPIEFSKLIEGNQLMWLRDFMYGKMHYLVKLTSILFEFSIFFFIANIFMHYSEYTEKDFSTTFLKLVVIASFTLLSISLYNNHIIEIILGIGINLTYYSLLIKTSKCISKYQLKPESQNKNKRTTERMIKYWALSAVAIQLVKLSHTLGLIHGNLYVSIKVATNLIAAILLTTTIAKLLSDIKQYGEVTKATNLQMTKEENYNPQV